MKKNNSCICKENGKIPQIYTQPSLVRGWVTEIVCFTCNMWRGGIKE